MDHLCQPPQPRLRERARRVSRKNVRARGQGGESWKESCLLDTTQLMHTSTHRNHGCLHMAWTSSNQWKFQCVGEWGITTQLEKLLAVGVCWWRDTYFPLEAWPQVYNSFRSRWPHTNSHMVSSDWTQNTVDNNKRGLWIDSNQRINKNVFMTHWF